MAANTVISLILSVFEFKTITIQSLLIIIKCNEFTMRFYRKTIFYYYLCILIRKQKLVQQSTVTQNLMKTEKVELKILRCLQCVLGADCAMLIISFFLFL